MPQADLAQVRQPSMGAVLGEVVGPWGETFVGVGVIISVLGAYLAWALLNAEVVFMPARSGVMPRALGRESRNGTPIAALLTTTLSIQVFLVLVLVVDDALDFMLELDTALTLVPYLLVAAYALKLTLTRETYDRSSPRERRRDQVVAALALVYSLVLLYAAGLEYLLLGCLVYAPGTFLYVRARSERGLRGFGRAEAAVCVTIWLVAVVAVVLLATGTLAI